MARYIVLGVLSLAAATFCAGAVIRCTTGFFRGDFDCTSAECLVQVKAPYDDVEMTNAGYQLEWIQRQKGEEPVYKTPPFVKTW
jgi:hypothetical protein